MRRTPPPADERTRDHPPPPGMSEMARRRRRVARVLTERRVELAPTRAEVADRMGTAQPAVTRIESGEVDVRLSTPERFADAPGGMLEWHPGAGG